MIYNINRQVIAACGGFTMESNNPLLDLYILGQSEKREPRICFLPTASGDNENYIRSFKLSFEDYPCRPFYLQLFNPKISDIEDYLLSMDIIYVGGGNTKSMLAIWREWGVDKILKTAYKKGIILAGVSAGAVCWFEECVTDSVPKKFTVMPCLGILPGSSCVHYNLHGERAQSYNYYLKRELIGGGFAVEDGTAIHFINESFHRAVSSRADAFAYKVQLNDVKEPTEQLIDTEFLGNQEIFNKHIVHIFNTTPDVSNDRNN